MSTLRERMDRLCEVFTAQDPAEIKAVMSGATEDLGTSDSLVHKTRTLQARLLPSLTILSCHCCSLGLALNTKNLATR